MNKVIFVLLIISLFSCKPYTKSDPKPNVANVEIDEILHHKNSLEWWYFTGHLKEKNGDRVFGVEYVFFHTTPFGQKDYTLMNMALTDPQKQTFYYDHEFMKRKKRMVAQNPINFKTENKGDTCFLKGFKGAYNLKGKMKNHDISFNLSTKPAKPVLMSDGTGYEKYGDVATAGYYSYTRLKTTGAVHYLGENIEVEGQLWYDRQWNCGGVVDQKVSWDWMAIQLENGDDLMLYQITTPIIENNKLWGGTYYTKQGEQFDLKSEDINLKPSRFWTSNETNISYPIDWTIEIPKYAIDLNLKAMVDNQELTFWLGAYHMKYWEGMCKVYGTVGKKKQVGNAYLEMTNRKMSNKFESFINKDLVKL